MAEELEVVFPTMTGVVPIQYKKIPVPGKLLLYVKRSFRMGLARAFILTAEISMLHVKTLNICQIV